LAHGFVLTKGVFLSSQGQGERSKTVGVRIEAVGADEDKVGTNVVCMRMETP